MLNRVEAIWTRAPRQLLAGLVFWNARRHGHSGHGDLVPLLSTPQELGAVRSLPYTPCSRLPFLLFCRHTALRAAEGLSHGPLRLIPGPLHGLWAASLAFQRPPSPRKRQTWAPGLSYHRDRRHRHQHCHLRHKRPFSVPPLDLCASCSFLLELFFFFFFPQKPTRITPLPPQASAQAMSPLGGVSTAPSHLPHPALLCFVLPVILI